MISPFSYYAPRLLQFCSSRNEIHLSFFNKFSLPLHNALITLKPHSIPALLLIYRLRQSVTIPQVSSYDSPHHTHLASVLLTTNGATIRITTRQVVWNRCEVLMLTTSRTTWHRCQLNSNHLQYSTLKGGPTCNAHSTTWNFLAFPSISQQYSRAFKHPSITMHSSICEMNETRPSCIWNNLVMIEAVRERLRGGI